MSETKKVSAQTSRKPVAKKLSKMESFEQNLTNSATESNRSEPIKLSIDFLKSIKEVVARRSNYQSDKCFASINFKDGRHKSVMLDFDVDAEPGDRLRLSSLAWVNITTDDGEEFTVLTGTVQ